MRLILAGVLIVAAIGGGGAAGHYLRVGEVGVEDAATEDAPVATPSSDALDAVALRQPFIVPIMRDGRVWSNAVLSLGVESATHPPDAIRALEPRLRDALNRALWTHGSLGGFDGDFTALDAMDRLRARLDAVAQDALEDDTARVLLMSLARQSN